MQRLRELGVWIWRAWPVVVLLFLGGIHLLALATLPAHSVMVNKLTGTAMQVVGGLVVLHSVNGNLGLFRNQTLAGVVVNWIRAFPMLKRSVTVSLTGVASIGVSGSATISTKRAATTVEERVAEVERQLEEFRVTVRAQDAALHRRIDDVKTELSSSISENQSAVKQISDQLESTAVGGFKQQAFGVMLAIYGAAIGVFV